MSSAKRRDKFASSDVSAAGAAAAAATATGWPAAEGMLSFSSKLCCAATCRDGGRWDDGSPRRSGGACLLQQRIHLVSRRCQRGGVAHGALHHVRLHVQVLKLALKLVHRLRHLHPAHRRRALLLPPARHGPPGRRAPACSRLLLFSARSSVLTIPANDLLMTLIFACVSSRLTTASRREPSFRKLSCSDFLRIAFCA